MQDQILSLRLLKPFFDNVLLEQSIVDYLIFSPFAVHHLFEHE